MCLPFESNVCKEQAEIIQLHQLIKQSIIYLGLLMMHALGKTCIRRKESPTRNPKGCIMQAFVILPNNSSFLYVLLLYFVLFFMFLAVFSLSLVGMTRYCPLISIRYFLLPTVFLFIYSLLCLLTRKKSPHAHSVITKFKCIHFQNLL